MHSTSRLFWDRTYRKRLHMADVPTAVQKRSRSCCQRGTAKRHCDCISLIDTRFLILSATRGKYSRWPAASGHFNPEFQSFQYLSYQWLNSIVLVIYHFLKLLVNILIFLTFHTFLNLCFISFFSPCFLVLPPSITLT